MLLLLDDIPFSTAIKIIKYCHERGIDTERSSLYYKRIKGTSLDLGNEDWVLEVPDHLITWFRMKYGGLE
jgi:hypothetical protein